MNSFDQDLARLFDGDDLPQDDSGVLGLLVAMLPADRVELAFLADDRGTLYSVSGARGPGAGEVTRLAEDLCLELTGADVPVVLRNVWRAGHAAAVPITTPQHGSGLLGLCLRPGVEPPPLEELQELSHAARLAWVAARNQEALSIAKTRVDQLFREEETLKASQAEVVAANLLEREERLREKRDAIHGLEHEVERRTRALMSAKERAEAATRVKDEFLANMSHEVRTPLTAILGYADLMASAESTPEERRAYTTSIRRSSDHLLAIFNDLLDISRLETGKLAVECVECSPLDVLKETVGIFRDEAHERGLKLELEFASKLPVRVRTDPTRLRQILSNLIGNAVKFTREGGVRVIARLDPEALSEAPRLRIDVVDTGIGLSESEQSRVFEAFTQVDSSTTRARGGTGLGLAIARNLARLMGGDVKMTSSPNAGSTFTVTIGTGSLEGIARVEPDCEVLDEQVGELQQERRIEDQPRAMGRVLLVEDGPDNQRLITALLRRAGAEVELADNGKLGCKKALSALREGSPFDLVLMDMQMPVLDGYEATALLRSRCYQGPIVAVTAHALEGDEAKCLAAGCDEYVPKPVHIPSFMAMVSRYLPEDGASRQAS